MSTSALRFGAAAGLAVLAFASTALAQAPAEVLPPSYAGTQYVDSTGCVFIRAEQSGPAHWEPRLTGSREHLCGFRPTFPASALAEEEGAGDAAIVAGSSPPEGAPAEDPASALASSSPTTDAAAGAPEAYAAGLPLTRAVPTAALAASPPAQVHRPVAAGKPAPAAAVAREVRSVPAAAPPQATVRNVLRIDARVPASNPATGFVTPPPPGYEPVWSDGRINFARGLRPVPPPALQ